MAGLRLKAGLVPRGSTRGNRTLQSLSGGNGSGPRRGVSAAFLSDNRKRVLPAEPAVGSGVVEEEGLPEEILEETSSDSSLATFYHGPAAIARVEALEGTLGEVQKHIVTAEGFVDGSYFDDAADGGIGSENVRTGGVGQTGTWLDKTFKETFEAFRADTISLIPSYNSASLEQQKALMSLAYRGDTRLKKTGAPRKWVGLFNRGKYKEAAVELLNHNEYRKRLAAGGDHVTQRLEAAARSLQVVNRLLIFDAASSG